MCQVAHSRGNPEILLRFIWCRFKTYQDYKVFFLGILFSKCSPPPNCHRNLCSRESKANRQLLGLSISDFVSDFVFFRLEILFNAQCRESIEMPVQTKSRNTLWVNFCVSPIYDETDSVAFHLCWVKTLSRNRRNRTDQVNHVKSVKGWRYFLEIP